MKHKGICWVDWDYSVICESNKKIRWIASATPPDDVKAMMRMKPIKQYKNWNNAVKYAKSLSRKRQYLFCHPADEGDTNEVCINNYIRKVIKEMV